jgi:hypothetical protein
MNSIPKVALFALALGAVGISERASAQTIVRFPVKGGVPITVSQTEPKSGAHYTVAREEPGIATAPRHLRYAVRTIGGHTAARVANN